MLTGSAEPASAQALLDVVGTVVVTAGQAGATWVDRTGVRMAAAVDARCVDSTGAGDAFNAGLIAAVLRGEPDPLAQAVGTAAPGGEPAGCRSAAGQPSMIWCPVPWQSLATHWDDGGSPCRDYPSYDASPSIGARIHPLGRA